MSSINASLFHNMFVWQHPLGRGNCASVHSYVNAKENKRVAVKKIDVHGHEDLLVAMNEVEVAKALQHPGMIKVHYTLFVKGKKDQLWIVMDLGGRSLLEEIKEKNRSRSQFAFSEITSFLEQTIEFFSYMQQKGYIHRDIKPDNILLSPDYTLEIPKYLVTDFGFAVLMSPFSGQNIAGTMEYVSPRLKPKFIDEKIVMEGNRWKDDVWSLGQTSLEMAVCRIGQSSNTQIDIKEIQSKYGRDVSDVIGLMLKFKEKDRPDFIQLEEFIRNMPSFSSEYKKGTISKSIALKNSLNKCENDTIKTKKKEKTATISIDECATDNQSFSISIPLKEQSKESLYNEQKPFQIDFKEPIYSICMGSSLVFVGLTAKIAVIDPNNQKPVFFIFKNTKRYTTVLKHFKQRIYAFGIDSKVRIIKISEIKNKMNSQRIIHNFQYLQVDTVCQVSSVDFMNSKALLGHYNGKISILNKILTEGQNQLPFVTDLTLKQTDVITEIKCKADNIHYSTSTGIFKYYQIKSGKINKNKAVKFYICHEPIVSFHLFQDDFDNVNICQSKRYFAALLLLSCRLCVISKEMQCLRLVEVGQGNLLACLWTEEAQKSRNLSGALLALMDDGRIVDTEGKVVAKGTGKGAHCFVKDKKCIYMGTYQGILNKCVFK